MFEHENALAPQIVEPVSRPAAGTAATEEGVDQSIWGGIQFKNIPFAGDDAR
ncbi:anacyclamide/piricyclamide family prenylated cyclic peptide [Amycolatopsis sp. NPDC051071]|uniref:anacyclamide/piricyclamide family prenylated cyclic peptide n=1 Tax=Amycolatopsis sp. NPDC051071 TaxID=3154637 RepID=UPI003443FC12